MRELSETIDRKYIDSIDLSDWEIETDTGWEDLTSISKTVIYDEWYLETENGLNLTCADTHIVFDHDYNQVFVKDLIPNISRIITKNGVEIVTKIDKLPSKSNMFDVSIASDNHRFWSNNILSHNSVTTIAFILWSVLFNDEYVVAVLANKGSLARELLGRLQKAYEHLPKWLQQGVVVWNKGSLELENGSKVFAYATSAAGVRGGSFNCITGDAKITIVDDYDRVFNINIEDADDNKYIFDSAFLKKYWESDYMFYTVYKITNLINNKQYIGYHSTNNLNDGYMGSGKLIIKAIEKYGIKNFKKEYIEIFNNQEDALALEAFLVCDDYILRKDTYNIALGGFGGPVNFSEEDDLIINGKTYFSYGHAKKSLGVSASELRDLILIEGNGFVNEEFHKNYLKKLADIEFRKKQHIMNLTYMCVGVKKTKEHVDKINKNPEKIRKTAEKHRGMKRSESTKLRMSLAKKGKSPHNKGKVYCYNPETLEKKLCFRDDVPNGWKFGYLKKLK